MKGRLVDLGRLAYMPAWREQERIRAEVLAGGPDTLVLVEHDPVITLGAAFNDQNLLLPREDYAARGIDVVQTDRGGDVTYHGPGQLVAYPIFDVNRHGSDVRRWLRDLEEVVICALAAAGLEGERFAPHTGVWTNRKKVAAIGVKLRRWVSLHGIALNCNNDLSSFELIVPCGISDHGVTSLSREAGRDFSIEDAKPLLVEGFARVFDLEFDKAE